MKTYTIDAKNKILGRAASEVASLLRGKKETDFAPNKNPLVKVIVENAGEIKFTGTKIKQKEYKRFSGYPGGLKLETLESALSRKGPAFVFRKAVIGMLPKNKLAAQLIKNLEIKLK